MSRPDLNLLLTLDVLLTECNVARAARRLHLSPSAMSRALARLRDTTGDPLLVRAGRGLVPTPRAQELREQVSRLVQEAQGVLRPAELLDPSRLSRHFTLRTSDGFVEYFGPALIALAQREAPGVRLRFVQKPDKDSAPLRDGSVDLETGVIGAASSPEIRTRALFRDRFIGVVRAGHPLARGKVTAARYAAGQHVLVRAAGSTKARSTRAARARPGARDRRDRRRVFRRPVAGARFRPDRQRARAPYRQPAGRNAQLRAAGRGAGPHRLDAVASAHGCRPRSPLAARMRAAGVRGLTPRRG
ncbi:LysR family transcriptional regulator [Achromobacter xylosoxidans]